MTTPVRRIRGSARGAAAAAVALTSLLTGAASASPAAAATAPATVPNGAIATYNTITHVATDGMGLRDSGAQARWAAGFESSHPNLKRTTINGVLANPSQTQARPLCHPSNTAGAQGFCWSAEDDATNTWIPQGLTGSGESPRSQALVNGRKVLLTSWYGTNAPSGMERITFADVTDPAHVTYKHVQLVMSSGDGANFVPVVDGHGHGIVWSGSKLYVASTGSTLDVFDLNDIWQMDVTSDTSVGVDANGKTHGGGHDYVLPRQGTYEYTGAGTGCGSYPGADVPERPCITAASLDLTGAQPALVTAEGDPGGVEGDFGKVAARIVRWPIDTTTGTLKADTTSRVQAAEAFASPMGGVQGVAMNKGRFALSGPCPEFVPAEHGGKNIPSCLYHAWPDQPVRLVTRTGINLENLSYWPGTDELWMVNENTDNRIVVRTSWPKDPAPTGMTNLTSADFTGDGKKDLVGVETASGKLFLYPGNGDGTFGDRVQIGTGWGAMDKLTAADYTGDGRADLVAVEKATGNLYVYPGTGSAGGTGTLGDRVRIGMGWNGMRELTALDVDGDLKADLVAVDVRGDLWSYPGTGSLNGTDTLGDRTQIGSGWDTMTELTSPGDLNGDGKGDLVAVDGTGALWAYPGTGSLNGMSTLGSRTKIGSGWDSMRGLVGADFNGDGKGDLDAVQAPTGATGPLYFYPGTGATALGDRTQAGSGW
ncbi:VCBS repeat-containing protein [Streptomyces sp. NPDC020719]|uniref:FG-GAP repeat domain-containing protein n=1 Tax=Streptomyces sp. NPDC020719 TaxID=3154896 RepID=UPI0033E5B44B